MSSESLHNCRMAIRGLRLDSSCCGLRCQVAQPCKVCLPSPGQPPSPIIWQDYFQVSAASNSQGADHRNLEPSHPVHPCWARQPTPSLPTDKPENLCAPPPALLSPQGLPAGAASHRPAQPAAMATPHALDEHAARQLHEAVNALKRGFSEGLGNIRDFPLTLAASGVSAAWPPAGGGRRAAGGGQHCFHVLPAQEPPDQAMLQC